MNKLGFSKWWSRVLLWMSLTLKRRIRFRRDLLNLKEPLVLSGARFDEIFWIPKPKFLRSYRNSFWSCLIIEFWLSTQTRFRSVFMDQLRMGGQCLQDNYWQLEIARHHKRSGWLWKSILWWFIRDEFLDACEIFSRRHPLLIKPVGHGRLFELQVRLWITSS